MHSTNTAEWLAIPTADPARAADELERTVRTYGFKGALINGHHRGRYLDDPFFAPILGWLGVFLTGSDTSSNALFCVLRKLLLRCSIVDGSDCLSCLILEVL